MSSSSSSPPPPPQPTILDPASLKLHKLELAIGNARLAADYSSQLPTLLRKWRKRLGTQSTILESLCSAEYLIHSLGKQAWHWPPLISLQYIYPHHITSFNNPTTDNHPSTSSPHLITPNTTKVSEQAKQTLTQAFDQIQSAYTSLLVNHELHPPTKDMNSSEYSKEFLETVRTQLSTSQLYLELVTVKAHILYARGEVSQCLAVLTNELTLPPTQQGLQLNPMGIIYLIKALTLMIACLIWDLPNSCQQSHAKIHSCLKFAMYMIPTSSINPNQVLHSCVPFASPIPISALTSVHVVEPLTYYLFVGSVNWIQAWLKALSVQTAVSLNARDPQQHSTLIHPNLCTLPELPSHSSSSSNLSTRNSSELPINQVYKTAETSSTSLSSSSSSSMDSFPTIPRNNVRSFEDPESNATSELLPTLSLQTLDLVRGYFVLCHAHNPFYTLFLAQWVVRFLVIWFVVIVRYDSAGTYPFPETIYAEYVPIDPALKSNWKADSLTEELDSLFQAWFSAILKIRAFPKAAIPDWQPSRMNKCMEELVVTLQWSDDLLGLKPFSIQMLESSIRHTFHSLLCHRVLAATHFRLGNIRSGLALLRRYIELREGIEDSASVQYDYWIYPEMNMRLIALYDQVGCARDAMFVEKDDGVNEYASLLVEGSQRLAENDELVEAVKVARQAYVLVSNHDLNTETSHLISVNLGSLLGVSALTATFDSTERSRLQGEAIELLKKALFTKPQSAAAHFHLALIYADRGELLVAKTHGKQVLKLNKSHIAGWHLLVLILTATRDFEGAVKMAELGIRESVASLVPTTHHAEQIQGEPSKRSTLDALTALARDQSLNCIWAPAEYDKIIASIFRLRLVQSRIVEQLRGTGSSIAVVQELFRWYKVVFDQDVTSPHSMTKLTTRRSGSGSGTSGNSPTNLSTIDHSRIRAESVRSTASSWSLSQVTGSAKLQVKQTRKRTMLASVLTHATVADRVVSEMNTTSSNSDSDRPRGQSITSVLSLTGSEASSTGVESVGIYMNVTRNEILAEMWICLSYIHLNSGQIKEALGYLNEAKSLVIKDPWLDGELGSLQYALGNRDEAMTRWHRLLSFDPHHVSALIGIARAHIDLGEVSEAELLLEDLTLYAGYMSVDAWYLYGRLCKSQNRPERALKYFHRALALERTEPIQDFARVPRLSLVTLL